MPMLREVRIPPGCRVYRGFLKTVNLAVLIFGFMTAVMTIEINPTPTFSPGWLLIFLGATTMLGGFTGFGTTLSFWYKSHVIFMSIAIFGTAIYCLVLFGQRPEVVASFQSPTFSEATVRGSAYTFSLSLTVAVDAYLSSISWVYIFVVIIECVALGARVLYERSAAQDQFETLEQTQDFRDVSLGKMQQDIGGHNDVVDRTKAGNLDSKMKDKYAKWSHEDIT